MESVRRWQCYESHERPQFSLKTGTIFEESPITLRKWLATVRMIANKNGISSDEIHRETGVTQKIVWFMGPRRWRRHLDPSRRRAPRGRSTRSR